MTLTVSVEDPGGVTAMLLDGDAFSAALYPAESNHMLDVDSLRRANVTFVVARLGADPVGTGAVVANDGWAEIKRMWVSVDARGSGAAQAIYQFLETRMRQLGLNVLRLETGIYNDAALRFYERNGFSRIGPFEPYVEDPYSVFMEKRLTSP